MPEYALAAFSSVCTHNGAFVFVSIANPTTLHSKQSKTAETYRFLFLALISVISVTHLANGSSALKSRFRRSSDFLAWGDTLKSSWFGKRNGILGWKLGDLPEGQGTAS